MLFQGALLFSALNVFDNVALPLRELKTLDEELIHGLVLLKLQVGRHGCDTTPPRRPLSSRAVVKRVALARALALDPSSLVLDEPTAGLDPDRSESFVQLIRRAACRALPSLLMVTHDLDTIAALSHRVAVLADQRLVAIGSVARGLPLRSPVHPQFSSRRARAPPRSKVPPATSAAPARCRCSERLKGP